jgi:hypothetical protein
MPKTGKITPAYTRSYTSGAQRRQRAKARIRAEAFRSELIGQQRIQTFKEAITRLAPSVWPVEPTALVDELLKRYIAFSRNEHLPRIGGTYS